MGRRQINPTTRPFDERLIVRKQEAFNYGMVTDIDAVDIPYNAVAHLENARGHNNSIRGRSGIKQWSSLKLPVHRVISFAKTGGVINASSGTVFTPDDVGSSVYINDEVILITEFVSSDVVKIGTRINIADGVYLNQDIRRRINAQYFDQTKGMRYLLIGSKLYARKGRENAWLEYFCVGPEPSNTLSQMFKVANKFIILNSGGIYAFNDAFDLRYMYKMNDSLPTGKISDSRSTTEAISSTPSAYRYLYTFSRMNGPDRLSGAVIDVETPPMYNTDIDYGEVIANVPVSSSRKKKILFPLTDYKSHLKWVLLTETKPYAHINIRANGVDTKCYLDFSAVESMDDVAKAFELALIDASPTMNCRAFSGGMYVWDSVSTVAWEVTTSADANDVAGQGIATCDNISSSMNLLVSGLTNSNRKDISHFSVYRTADIAPYLSTPVDVTDPRIGNNPDIYGWVADIPVVEIYRANITNPAGKSMIDLGRTGGDHLIGMRVKIRDTDDVEAGSAIIDSKVSGNRYMLSGFIGIVEGQPYSNIGVDIGDYRVSDGNKVGAVVTSNTDMFTADDVGGLLFWESGRNDIISEYVGPREVRVIEENSNFTNLRIAMAKTSSVTRSFSDTVSDTTRSGYAREYTLKTRFMEQMPSGSIGCIHNGVLLTGRKDQDKIWYTDTTDFRHIGYHNSLNQANDSLNKNVQCMFIVNDLFAILTTSSTYTINPKQATVVTSELGEFYTRLPDPYLVNNSIGAANQFRWSRGEKGDVMVVTSEPAVRFFDGVNWTANLANEKIQNTELDLMNENMISSYSGTGGIHIWGYRSELWM